MAWIRRNKEATIRAYAKNFSVLLLTGCRQSGKTSLLRHMYPRADYVTFDLPSNAERAINDPLGFLNSFGRTVIIDEIQYAPSLLRIMKYVVDQEPKKRGRFLLTGSQKFAMMDGISESLAGRAGILELDTLGFSELEANRKITPVEYVLKGGFPALYAGWVGPTESFFSSYLATYLERDVRSGAGIENLAAYERFLRVIAARCGQLANFSNISQDVGVSPTTINHWLSYTVSANHAVTLSAYHENFTKRIIKAPKLYMMDSGMLCYLLGIESEARYLTHERRGAIWENLVLGELKRSHSDGSLSSGIYYWRDSNGLEVDFVLEREGRITLVEAKSGEFPTASDTKNIRKLLALMPPGKAADRHYVICNTPSAYPISMEPRIDAITLRDIEKLTF